MTAAVVTLLSIAALSGLVAPEVYAQTGSFDFYYDATARNGHSGRTVVAVADLAGAADGGFTGTIQVTYQSGFDSQAGEVYLVPVQGSYRVQKDGDIVIRARSDRNSEISVSMTVEGALGGPDPSGHNFEVNEGRSSLNIKGGVGKFAFMENPDYDAYIELP
ncbi:MAG: hypothetical protein ACE5PO_02165 [Candidatus Bathyarchaeia archaeon]